MAMERVAVAVTSGLLLAVLLAVLAPSPALALDCGHNKSHNAFIGNKHRDDKLLFIGHPIAESKWLRTVSADVATGNLEGDITFIEVLDQKTNGNGGCGYLTSGGVRCNNAGFHFESQRGHGLNFIIRVWGRPY